MKIDELDIQLLLDLLYTVPAGYDITNIDFTGGQMKVNCSFDYIAAKKEADALERERQAEEFHKTLKQFQDGMNEYFDKKQRGLLPVSQPAPKRPRGRPRKNSL